MLIEMAAAELACTACAQSHMSGRYDQRDDVVQREATARCPLFPFAAVDRHT